MKLGNKFLGRQWNSSTWTYEFRYDEDKKPITHEVAEDLLERLEKVRIDNHNFVYWLFHPGKRKKIEQSWLDGKY